MRKIFYSTFMALIFFAACQETDISFQKQEKLIVPKNIEQSNIEFCQILSRAIKDKVIRVFLKEEALAQIDKDYDVIYHYVKNKEMSNGITFREGLSKYTKNINHLDSLTEMNPILTISIPYIEKQNNIYMWDALTQIPIVVYRENYISKSETKLKAFKEKDLSIFSIDRYSKPNFIPIVVKSNERLVSKGQQFSETRTVSSENVLVDEDNIFCAFSSDAFNNLDENKKKKERTRSLRSSDEYSVDAIVDFNMDDRFYISSFIPINECARDYIYYGISPFFKKDKGDLQIRYKEAITAIQFNDYSALTHVNDIANQSPDADWSDGNLEIKFFFSFLTKDAPISTVDKMISVPINLLFKNREKKTIEYQLEKPIHIFNWDLQTFGNKYRVDLFEYDPGTSSDHSISLSSQYGHNFEVSAEAGPFFNKIIKVGAKYSYSKTETNSSQTTIKSTNNSDPLGGVIVDFFDPIYLNNEVQVILEICALYDDGRIIPYFEEKFTLNRNKLRYELETLIDAIKNGEFGKYLSYKNPFGGNTVIYIKGSTPSSYPKYKSNTGMVTLGIEPVDIYK